MIFHDEKGLGGALLSWVARGREAPSTRSGSAFRTVKSTPFALPPNVSSYAR
jgi:hypothetical protein